MLRKYIIVLIATIFYKYAISQTSEFQVNYKKFTTDSDRVVYLNKYGELNLIFRISYWDSLITICKENLAKKESPFFKKYLSIAYGNIGYIYNDKGKINLALENYFEAVKISDFIKDEGVSANTYNSIAYVYDHQGDFENAINYYRKSYKLYYKLNDKEGQAMLLNNIGFLFKAGQKFDSAEYYLKKSYEQYKINNNIQGQGILLNNLGSLLNSQGRTNEAKQYYLLSKPYFEKLNHRKGLTTLYCNLGKIYLEQDSLKLAKEYADKSLAIANENNNPADLIDVSILLYNYYKKTNDIKNALFYHELYSKNKDSLNKKELKSSILKQQIKFEFDRKAYADSLKYSNEKQLLDLKIQKSNTQRYGLIIVIILISLLAYLLYRKFKDTSVKNKLIEEQKKLVDEKQKEIIDSINYAKKIQEAIFTDKELKYEYFPDAFVLFQPKDIVSGDFYWFASKKGKRIIAVADCTGHGVPGALMSMIGISFLNEIVIQQGITDTSEILSELRHKVIHSLKQSSSADSAKDGMDIAIICIDDQKGILEYSGANNPMWQIKDGKLIEFNPDKRPIGYFLGKGLPFNKHTVDLVKGDTYYIFSDGYADQFGGPKGKKFKYKQLENLLISINQLPMVEQEEILLNEINTWKGSLEQTDDICVIGIRI